MPTRRKTIKKNKKKKDFSIISQIPNIKKILLSFIKPENKCIFDNNGDPNFRELGGNKKEIILIFKKKEDTEKICKTATEAYLKMKNELPKDINFIFERFEGNPLNTNTNYSKIKVKNPDPLADENYYSSFGEVHNVERIKGYDIILFKSLKNFLPAIEEHAIWKYPKGPKKRWLFINPEEENKASPQYCILKKYHKKEKNYQILLKYLKENYKKVKVKRVDNQIEKEQNTQNIISLQEKDVETEKKENPKNKEEKYNEEEKETPPSSPLIKKKNEKQEINNTSKQEKKKEKSPSFESKIIQEKVTQETQKEIPKLEPKTPNFKEKKIIKKEELKTPILKQTTQNSNQTQAPKKKKSKWKKLEVEETFNTKSLEEIKNNRQENIKEIEEKNWFLIKSYPYFNYEETINKIKKADKYNSYDDQRKNKTITISIYQLDDKKAILKFIDGKYTSINGQLHTTQELEKLDGLAKTYIELEEINSSSNCVKEYDLENINRSKFKETKIY
jgi:hypothetical protein